MSTDTITKPVLIVREEEVKTFPPEFIEAMIDLGVTTLLNYLRETAGREIYEMADSLCVLMDSKPDLFKNLGGERDYDINILENLKNITNGVKFCKGTFKGGDSSVPCG